jgi:hypothetical protein
MNHIETYIFQPALLMFVLINVWRMTPKLRWTINPNIAFLFTFFGMSCMVQAILAAISCTIFVVLQYHRNQCEVLHDTQMEGVCQEESPPLNRINNW